MSKNIDWIVDKNFSLESEGYNKKEVDNFLDEICDLIEDMEEKIRLLSSAKSKTIINDGKLDSSKEKTFDTYDEKYDDLFTTKAYMGGCIIEKYNGFDNEDIVIPSMIDGKKVFGIYSKAFYNASSIRSVKISKGIITIGNKCFCCCKNLKKVTIADTVKVIGDHAFSETNIDSIILPDSLIYMGMAAFGDTSIKKIQIPGSLKTISSNVFAKCEKLEEVIVQNGVVKIDYNAFGGCKNLKRVILSNSIKEIEKQAFCNCTSLLEIDIPPSVINLEENIFVQSYIVQPDLRYNPRTCYMNLPITIICIPGSKAQEYARINGFNMKKSLHQYSSAQKSDYELYRLDFDTEDHLKMLKDMPFFNKDDFMFTEETIKRIIENNKETIHKYYKIDDYSMIIITTNENEKLNWRDKYHLLRLLRV